MHEFPPASAETHIRVSGYCGSASWGLKVRLDDGNELCTRALVLPHGLKRRAPSLPGIEPLWGRSVYHCPFCDAWEVRDRALAVLAVALDHTAVAAAA